MKKCLMIVLVLLLAACRAEVKEKYIGIKFNTNGAGEINELNILLGTEIDLPNLTKQGYKFDGWQYNNVIVTGKVTFNEDVLLHARWTKLQYNVNFFDYDGKLLSSLTIKHGDKAPSPAYPEKEGYSFISWDQDISRITSDLNIHPLYEEATTGLVFELIENEYYLIAYNGTNNEVIIPSIYKGLSVVEISDDAFNNNLIITKVVIPETIKRIGKNAFYNCLNLNEINFPLNLDLIDTKAFYSCDQLSEITISAKVIGEEAFHTCSNLSSITLLDSVKVLSARSFYSCSRLSEFYIPSSVDEIGDHIFSWCRNLVVVYANANIFLQIQKMIDNNALIYLNKDFHVEIISE